MRIHLQIKAKSTIIPYDHQELLVGTIHKWLGWNEEHGKVSLYTFSSLSGGAATKEGLKLGMHTSFFFSAHNEQLIKRLLMGIRKSPEMFKGLIVEEVKIEEDPDLSNREIFYVGSPIFIKRIINQHEDFIYFDNKDAGQYLEATLKTKLKEANIPCQDFSISFMTDYKKATIRKINFKGTDIKANICPVIIKGSPDLKLFAWNVGLGNSTGIGFGALK